MREPEGLPLRELQGRFARVCGIVVFLIRVGSLGFFRLLLLFLSSVASALPLHTSGFNSCVTVGRSVGSGEEVGEADGFVVGASVVGAAVGAGDTVGAKVQKPHDKSQLPKYRHVGHRYRPQ